MQTAIFSRTKNKESGTHARAVERKIETETEAIRKTRFLTFCPPLGGRYSRFSVCLSACCLAHWVLILIINFTMRSGGFLPASRLQWPRAELQHSSFGRLQSNILFFSNNVLHGFVATSVSPPRDGFDGRRAAVELRCSRLPGVAASTAKMTN